MFSYSRYFQGLSRDSGTPPMGNQQTVPTSTAFSEWQTENESGSMFLFLVSVSYVPVVLHVSDISKDFPGYQAPFLQKDQHRVPGHYSKPVRLFRGRRVREREEWAIVCMVSGLAPHCMFLSYRTHVGPLIPSSQPAPSQLI